MTHRHELTTRFGSRLLATGRAMAHAGRASASHWLGDSDASARLVQELDELKGMAMKVGQILSYLDVGLPDDVTASLAHLQRGADPLAFSVVQAELERSLAAPLDQLFDTIDPEPVAAASIGQVHRATLGGRDWAVKVRYPGIEDTLRSDFQQLGAIGRLASLGTAVDGRALVDELRTRVLEECDYGHEADEQEAFRTLLADVPTLVVPEVRRDRCGDGVLTTAWWEGQALFDVDPSEQEALASSLVQALWGPLARGVLHADPHPGNYLWTGDRLVMLDFGCVRHLSALEARQVLHLLATAIDGSDEALRRAILDAEMAPRPDRIDWERMLALWRWMVAPYRSDRFTFRRDWWEEGLAFSRPSERNLRHQALPPHWIWVQRSLWGLHAVLLRLGVSVDARTARADALPG